MTIETEDTIGQPDFETMTPGRWRGYLKEHPDLLLCINAPDGVHTIEYDETDDSVTFYAHGSQGYDFDGTQAVLEEIACADGTGLNVQTKAETYN